jgi:hypothetical protein
VAAVAEAEADATAAEQDTEAPALVEVRAQVLLIAAVRLALGFAGLVAAAARGTERSAAVELFVLGAGVLLLAVFTGARRGRFSSERVAHAERVPPGARMESRTLAVAKAAYPSTIGLTALIAIALWPQPSLAALLAGILAGLGIAALVFATQLAVWEQKRGTRVLAEPGHGGRIYEEPR